MGTNRKIFLSLAAGIFALTFCSLEAQQTGEIRGKIMEEKGWSNYGSFFTFPEG